MSKFEPMSASSISDFAELNNYPYIVSAKLDGIRCIKWKGELYARSLKLIPNKLVQEKFADVPDGADGELIISDWVDRDVFSKTQSIVSSQKDPDSIQFVIFDDWSRPEVPYETRYYDFLELDENEYTRPVPAINALSLSDVENVEKLFVSAGYEGIMLRRPYGLYKYGRSTSKQEYLIKYKRFYDMEVKIVGFNEKISNQNEAKKNETGHTERSSAKAGMVPAGTLGSLVCSDSSGNEFGCGTGFNDALRQEIWDNREKYLGAYIKVKYQEITKDNVPRFPVFLAFREEWDMAKR